jgi:lipopolysaccharide transport system ATP-binding protein
MGGPAILVRNLGKIYRIGGPVERYRTFRDSVAQGFARAGRRLRSWLGGGDGAAAKYETIWALKDVSFEIQPGEVVGLIGRNGAGKSTLLKILSRITEPTEGRAVVRGRVGSLLEVGTGFHPELTGRENVYLNGAILGMKRAEVDRKFDEIVDFAEMGKFIDTPVKHYSSGMYVRLAFSVAAHLDTDILLVDEVLSVGDVKFQQKCMGRMQDRTFAGKAILFVSHNLTAISNFCPRTVYLDRGQVVKDGDTKEVLPLYLTDGEATFARDLAMAARRAVHGELWRCMKRATLLRDGTETGVFPVGSPWTLRVECEIPEALAGKGLNFGFTISDMTDRVAIGANTQQYGFLRRAEAGPMRFEARLGRLPLTPGRYRVSLYLGDGQRDHEVIENACQFDVMWTPQEAVVRPPHVGLLHEFVEWK